MHADDIIVLVLVIKMTCMIWWPTWSSSCRTVAFLLEWSVHVAGQQWDIVSFPDPPRKRKEGLVFWGHFLSHGAGLYFVKNVIIAFLNPEVEFLMSQFIWTTTHPGLQKLEMATIRVYWDSQKQRLQDKFSLFLIRFKIQSLMSCNYN